MHLWILQEQSFAHRPFHSSHRMSRRISKTLYAFNRINLHTNNGAGNKVIVYLLFHKCVTTPNPITRPNFCCSLVYGSTVTDVYNYAKLEWTF